MMCDGTPEFLQRLRSMSVSAAQFEESLQSPPYAESDDGSKNRAHGFMSRAGGSAPASERIPDEG